jgi:hypothetical protein
MAGETLSIGNNSTAGTNAVDASEALDAAAAAGRTAATDRSIVGGAAILHTRDARGTYTINNARFDVVTAKGVSASQELADLYRDWADPGMIPPHEDWHSENGSGGTQGVGSGEKFLMFHEQMLSDFLQKVKAEGSPELLAALTDKKGVVRLPLIDFTKDVPDAYFVDKNGIDNRRINYKTPDFLERKSQQAKNGKDGETFSFTNGAGEQQTVTSLEDIKTLDDLGRVIGESGAHAVGHVELGGQMGSFDSVAVAAFLLWHGWVVEVTQEWLKTPNGKAWKPEASRSMDNALSHMGHDMDAMEVAPSTMLADAEAAADRAAEAAEKAEAAMNAGDANAEALAEEARSMLQGAELMLAKARAEAEEQNVTLNETRGWSDDVGTVEEESEEFKESFISSMKEAAKVAIERQETATGATDDQWGE